MLEHSSKFTFRFNPDFVHSSTKSAHAGRLIKSLRDLIKLSGLNLNVLL